MADIEEELEKNDIRRVKLGSRKLKVLGYADDLVILAEKKRRMRWLLKRLEIYMDKKGLMVNTEKTKMIRFMKEGRKGRKRNSGVRKKEEK